jgi:hypothetical protein
MAVSSDLETVSWLKWEPHGNHRMEDIEGAHHMMEMYGHVFSQQTRSPKHLTVN